MWKFLETFWTVRDNVWTIWAVYAGNYASNYVLVSRRPEMGMDFGSIKRNRCRMGGLPTDRPLALF